MKFLIYCEQSSARLTYILNFFFNTLWDWEYRLTNNLEEFHAAEGPKFSYGSRPLNGELFVYSNGLLFENDVRDRNVDVFDWKNSKALFKSPFNSEVEFDVFSAAFYLISRYEEYLPFIADEHGRFTAENSMAFKNAFLEDPVIDMWADNISNVFSSRFGIEKNKRKYHFKSTVDIDNAFAYRGKGFLRTIAALAQSLVRFNKNDVLDRLAVLSRQQKDPYDTYNILDRWHDDLSVDVTYFFLLGHYGKYDKNLPATSRLLTDLIKRAGDKYKLGMHPSYASNSDPVRMDSEKANLERVSLRKIEISRQHYLRLKFPSTYRALVEVEIKEDHTMGYADHVGFRAGTCSPFFFFDLERNMATSLRVNPFAVMDATLNRYMKLGPDAAIEKTKTLIQKVKHLGGTFILLWHNETLSEMHHWRGWRDVYFRIIKIGTDE